MRYIDIRDQVLILDGDALKWGLVVAKVTRTDRKGDSVIYQVAVIGGGDAIRQCTEEEIWNFQSWEYSTGLKQWHDTVRITAAFAALTAEHFPVEIEEEAEKDDE